MSILNGLLGNKLLVNKALGGLKDKLKENGLHGYYITFDDCGEVIIREYKIDPSVEILNLKKTLLTK